MLVKPITEEEITVSAMLTAIMTTERKRECPLPFPGKKHKRSKAYSRFCYKCGYFVKRLAKPTILCYYFNSKTQRLKYQ